MKNRLPGSKVCVWRGDLGDCFSQYQARGAGGSARESLGMISAGSNGGSVQLHKLVWLQGTGPGGREVGKSSVGFKSGLLNLCRGPLDLL